MTKFDLLPILAPFLSAGVIYLLRHKLVANWSRGLVLTLLTPILFTLLLLLAGFIQSSSSPLTQEDLDTFNPGPFMIVLATGFAYLATLLSVFLVREKHVNFLKKSFQQYKTQLSFASIALIAIITAWSLFSVVTQEINPQNRLKKSAARSLANGECEQATLKYIEAIEKFENKAQSYAQWAKAYIICPDKNFRNSQEAIELIQKATEFGDFDIELARIAVCAFSANGNYERASKIARDNGIPETSSLPELQKNCFR